MCGTGSHFAIQSLNLPRKTSSFIDRQQQYFCSTFAQFVVSQTECLTLPGVQDEYLKGYKQSKQCSSPKYSHIKTGKTFHSHYMARFQFVTTMSGRCILKINMSDWLTELSAATGRLCVYDASRGCCTHGYLTHSDCQSPHPSVERATVIQKTCFFHQSPDKA